MPACKAGFKSCKFKGAKKQWVAHCVRCGRRSADADWRLGIRLRPGQRTDELADKLATVELRISKLMAAADAIRDALTLLSMTRPR